MMKARHFGASSYDDDYDEEEDGPMDMSGFMTSSETQPPVIERPRFRSNPPPQGNPPQGLGNLGPKTVAPPRPVSNMGYTPKMVSNAADNGTPGSSAAIRSSGSAERTITNILTVQA